jgi:hypothetical protein
MLVRRALSCPYCVVAVTRSTSVDSLLTVECSVCVGDGYSLVVTRIGAMPHCHHGSSFVVHFRVRVAFTVPRSTSVDSLLTVECSVCVGDGCSLVVTRTGAMPRSCRHVKLVARAPL